MRRIYLISMATLLLLGNIVIIFSWSPSSIRYRPLIGGIEISIYSVYYSTGSEYYDSSCTIAYSAKYGSRKGVLTAGHCFDFYVYKNGRGWSVYQPDKNLNLNDKNYIGRPIKVSKTVDSGFIFDPVYTQNNISNEILTTDRYGNPISYIVYNYISWEELVTKIGTHVRFTGYVSGVGIGIIEKTWYSWYGIYKYYVEVNTICFLDGDSGGPVYKVMKVREGGELIDVIILYGVISGGGVSNGYCWTKLYFIASDGIYNELGVEPYV